jgi:hypothetical protein
MLVRRAPTIQGASQMQQFHERESIVVGPERPGGGVKKWFGGDFRFASYFK